MNAQITKHVADADVQDVAEEASKAACAVLDGMFPGYDNGGINSTFAAQLEKVILLMLAVQTVLQDQSMTASLPRHVLTDASFGSPLARGDAFLVVRRVGLNPMAFEFEALNDGGDRFVALNDVDNIDPFTSYEAAVQGALAYLRGDRAQGTFIDYKVVPASHGATGYVLNPAANPYAGVAMARLSPDCLC